MKMEPQAGQATNRHRAFLCLGWMDLCLPVSSHHRAAVADIQGRKLLYFFERGGANKQIQRDGNREREREMGCSREKKRGAETT